MRPDAKRTGSIMPGPLPDDVLQKTANIFWACGQNIRETSRIMGLSPSTVHERIQNIEKRGIKPRVRVSGGKDNPETVPERHTVVWFTDAHNQPEMPLDRFLWLAALVNDVKPDYLIDGGDFDDMNSLCAYEGNETWKGKFKPAFVDDLSASQEARELLDEKITHKCVKHFVLGNHEDRLWQYENRNPEVYGMMQHAYLEVHKNWHITPYRGYLDIHGVDFTHIPMSALNKPAGGARAAVSVAAKSVRDVCFGHTHTYGYWEESKFGPNRSTIAINGGCFMPQGYIPKYAAGSAKSYWYGVHILGISGGRIVEHTPITMQELKRRYNP